MTEVEAGTILAVLVTAWPDGMRWLDAAQQAETRRMYREFLLDLPYAAGDAAVRRLIATWRPTSARAWPSIAEANAWRFVRARRPNAKASRECRGWPRSSSVVVCDWTAGAPWCYATGQTAGEAWLRCARQMVEHDEKEAADRQALEAAVAALRSAGPGALEAAALRYAAERIRQGTLTFGAERGRWSSALLQMAEECEGR